jgi:hypothetical protein
MNSTHTMPRLPAAAPRDSFPRRSVRLLLRGPASLTSPVARWAVTLLVVAGAGLLLSAGVGLFGYVESLAVPYAEASLVVEFTSAAVLAFAAAIVLAAPRLSRRS